MMMSCIDGRGTLTILSAVFTTLCKHLWSMSMLFPYHTVMQLVKILSDATV